MVLPGRLALWSYLTGQVVSSPGGARGWVSGATGSASAHSTQGSSISGRLLRRSATIGDVLDSLLALAGDAFYAAAVACHRHGQLDAVGACRASAQRFVGRQLWMAG